MKIFLKKFGTMLLSTTDGKEAFLAFSPTLNEIKEDEPIEVDFEGVLTFSPSWGAEFLEPLVERFGKRVTYLNTENPSVKATLEFLKEIGEGS